MFYLIVNFLLIILSYQCLSASQHGVRRYQSRTSDGGKCILFIPTANYTTGAIAFTNIRSNPKIMEPDNFGNIVIESNLIFKMTCTLGLYFQPPIQSHYSEITVRCLNGSFIEHGGEAYRFDQFICTDVPSPKLKITNITCQNEKGKIIETGFFTKSAFLLVFSICYDFKNKNTLYSWYTRQSPYFMRRQTTSMRPHFKRTSLFGADINALYKYQNETLETILGSKTLIRKYILPEIEFLARGHLIARVEFNYYVEQLATFFYENTAPQWNTFNQGVWRSLEKYLRRALSKGDVHHLIVSGTYKTCTLKDHEGVRKPIYLHLPNNVRVPLFVWKMDYDLKKRKGIVYIGINNPYIKIQESLYICPAIPCPSGTRLVNIFGRGFLYCCTNRAFEKVYGKLDNIVYRHS